MIKFGKMRERETRGNKGICYEDETALLVLVRHYNYGYYDGLGSDC
jgi:hypothetical protein